jgi:hypothetical protein
MGFFFNFQKICVYMQNILSFFLVVRSGFQESKKKIKGKLFMLFVDLAVWLKWKEKQD